MVDSGEGRSFRTYLGAIVAGGAALRLVRLALTKWNHRLLLNDSLYYSAQARQLAHGVWFHEIFTDQPGAEHGPLTSTLMAVASWGSDPFNRQRLVTVACGIVTVAVIGLIGRKVAGDRAGLVAAALAAVAPNLWVSDGLVMSESVSCLLVALTLLAVLRWTESPTVRRAVLCGVVIGLAALARSELLLLALLTVALMILVSRRRSLAVGHHAAIAVAMTALVILPWVIFNSVRFDDPVLLTTNEGSLLVGANCDESYYGPALGGWSLNCVLDAQLGENGDDTSVRTAQQRRLALSYVRHHLGRVPVVVVARIGRTLDLYRVSATVHGDVGEEREAVVAWAGVVTFWVLVPLAFLGARRLRRLHRAVLTMPILLVAIATVVFYGGHRMRSAAEPAIVVLAAVALTRRTPSRRTPPPTFEACGTHAGPQRTNATL